jgi:acetyl esterase/lipase
MVRPTGWRSVELGESSTKFPVVINFHGGGITIGSPNHDARWATAATQTGAVVISVGYRLPPEYPHPVGIEDDVDAILWVHKHGSKYGLDPSRIALTGFSAGGNMVFAIALRLFELEQKHV